MSNPFADMNARIASLEKRLAGMMRHGPVKEVNAKEGWVRLDLGQGTDGPLLSPKIPYAQMAGALKAHVPPSEGQQMTYFAPGGDPRQAIALPMTWSDKNKSPSEKGDENVFTFGAFKAEIRGNELVVEVPRILLKCGGTTFELTAAGLKAVAPDFDFKN